MELTQELVKELYDYKDGCLYHKKKRCRVTVGAKVGFTSKDGYGYTFVHCNHILVHRLIFLWHHGWLPEFVDHENGKRSDNKIENLRPATVNENAKNRGIAKNNSTGVTGVKMEKHKYRAEINVNKKRIALGTHKTLEEATAARKAAEIKYFGEFARKL